MKTTKLLPKRLGFVAILFTVMAAGFPAAAFAQQKSIRVTGIPNNYTGKKALLGLCPKEDPQNVIAASIIEISGASVTFPLLSADKPWNGNGNFVFRLFIFENEQAFNDNKALYMCFTLEPVNVSQTTTTVQWSQFTTQKFITVTGIPRNYTGKIAVLGLLPKEDTQNIIAYSIIEISGALDTFPLLGTADKPWNGNGNFVFGLIIYENVQAYNDQKPLGMGTTLPINVSQTITTVQWSQFK